MTIGEIRTRYRVYDTKDFLYASKDGRWTQTTDAIATFDDHTMAFKHAHNIAGRAFEAGEVIIKPVRFRVVPSKTSRELARVTEELATANKANDRLAAALRRAITETIPQEEKADFLREAMGRPAVDGKADGS